MFRCKEPFVVLLVVLTVLTLGAAADAGILETGLVEHLDANSAPSGNFWPALVGTDAELIDGVSYQGTGIKRYSFNGTDGWARVQPSPMSAAQVNNGYTIEVWVRPDTSSGEGTIADFDRIAPYQPNNAQTGLRTEGTDFRAFHRTSDTFNQGAVAPGAVKADLWTHVTVSYDGTKFTGFVNGQQKDDWNSTAGVANIERMMLGAKKSRFSSAVHDYFDGRIAMIRVYDDALAASEVAQNFTSSIPQIEQIEQGFVTDGLKVHLDARAGFNSDSHWQNLALGGNNAAMTDATLVSDDPTGVAHYAFNGSTSFGQIDGNPLADVGDVNDGFTIEVWARPRNNTDFQALGVFDHDGSPTHEVGLRISDDSPPTGTRDYYAFRQDTSGFDRFQVVDEAPEIPLDEWGQIVLTWDGSEFTGYKNGSLDTSTTATLNLSDIDMFLLGSRLRPEGVLDMFFEGDQAIVRVYDDVLRDAEIHRNFHANAMYFGIPEPSAFVLLGIGMAALALVGRRRKRSTTAGF